MAEKNLCKRCALSGTEACPPGWVRISTSEGVVSCSGFEPKPMVPRREDAKPPDFLGWAHSSLNLREKVMRHECDQARAERDAVAAGVQDLHDRLLRAREKACLLRAELEALKQQHTELCGERNALREERDALNKKLDYFRDKRNTLREERNALREELDCSKQDLKDLSTAHNTLHRKHDELREELDLLKSQALMYAPLSAPGHDE